MNIYLGKVGRNLMNPTSYTPIISSYRAAECELLAHLAAGFDLVTEVGCAEGMCAPYLSADGKRYVGLDINASCIQRARKKHHGNEHISFHQVDFETVLRTPVKGGSFPFGGLLVLPFNVFGSFDRFHGLLKAASERYDALVVSTYAAGPRVNNERLAYYQRAGLGRLKLEAMAEGVCISDGTGFRSMAFSQDWYLNEFAAAGLEMHAIPVTSIGVVYSSFRPS
jgi:SAM-dependent methyltransferase